MQHYFNPMFVVICLVVIIHDLIRYQNGIYETESKKAVMVFYLFIYVLQPLMIYGCLRVLFFVINILTN